MLVRCSPSFGSTMWQIFKLLLCWIIIVVDGQPQPSPSVVDSQIVPGLACGFVAAQDNLSHAPHSGGSTFYDESPLDWTGNSRSPFGSFYGNCPGQHLARFYQHSAVHREFWSGVGWPAASWNNPYSLPFKPTVWRIGEAHHPGPALRIGVCNPSGAIGKSDALLDLPKGIWNVAESHLAAPSMRALEGQLRHGARRDHRKLRILMGSPAPLRTRSQSAGVWAESHAVGGHSGQSIHFQWPNQEHTLGRVMTAVFSVGPSLITGACVYGWPTSPTWSSAALATNTMLSRLTEEIVLNRTGYRFIGGDFNHDNLQEFHAWEQAGWIEVQNLRQLITGQAPRPTFRGQTRPDKLYVSPELAALFMDSHVQPALLTMTPCLRLFTCRSTTRPFAVGPRLLSFLGNVCNLMVTMLNRALRRSTSPQT